MRKVSVRVFRSDFALLSNTYNISGKIRQFVEECINERFTQKFGLIEQTTEFTFKVEEDEYKLLEEYVKGVYNGTVSEFVRNCIHAKAHKLEYPVIRIEKIRLL